MHTIHTMMLNNSSTHTTDKCITTTYIYHTHANNIKCMYLHLSIIYEYGTHTRIYYIFTMISHKICNYVL